jgi:hypothetical protein
MIFKEINELSFDFNLLTYLHIFSKVDTEMSNGQLFLSLNCLFDLDHIYFTYNYNGMYNTVYKISTQL